MLRTQKEIQGNLMLGLSKSELLCDLSINDKSAMHISVLSLAPLKE